MPHSEHRADIPVLPATARLLIAGGDERIELDPVSGLNKYGCRPFPDSALLGFGSSTASTISDGAYQAADRLRERLACAFDESEVSGQMARIRQELLDVVGCPGADLVFTASGTDAHKFAAKYVQDRAGEKLTVVMVEEAETGSGVAAALATCGVEVRFVPLRTQDGEPRTAADIDRDFEVEIGRAAWVLLIMVDQSKTGLIAPTADFAASMHRKYSEKLDVLVDACQFRVSVKTLRAYLQQGFLIALTGSKFFSGPSFSAAVLLPDGCVPGTKNDSAGLVERAGLLLRWEAALYEMRRFNALPQEEIVRCLKMFADALENRLDNDPSFIPLAVPRLDRRALLADQGWDCQQTIFPFMLRDPQSGLPIDRGWVRLIYRQLQQDMSGIEDSKIARLRCQFGQPVACGVRDGVEVGALRLCVGARQIGFDRIQGVISDALLALDKTAWLATLQLRD